MLTIFYLIIIAHFAADFILQGPLSAKKRGLNLHMLAHSAIVSLGFLVLLIDYSLERVIPLMFYYFLSHVVIDAVRVEINIKLKLDPGKYMFWFFLGLDQIAHVSIAHLLIKGL